MDKIVFADFQTKICSAWLNAVSDTVWDALGQAKTPQEAIQFIGAVEEAPNDGKAYLRSNLSWLQASTSLLHNDLGGRDIADAHPMSAITGLDTALSAKAPIASPAFTGNPTAPTPSAGNNDTSIATTAFVKTALDNQSSSGMPPSDDPPLMNGVAYSGTSSEGSRSDHVHPTDTSRAPSSAATASGTSFTPAGNIAATNVQAAIAELDSETQASLALKSNITTTVTKTSSIGAANIPAGLETDRPASPVNGQFRYNSTDNVFEGYTPNGWGQVGGGQMYGSAQVKAIFYNSTTIGEDLTVKAGENGGSFGPVIVNNGFSVTVEPGSVWSIV